jgi:hypothetical protein
LAKNETSTSNYSLFFDGGGLARFEKVTLHRFRNSQTDGDSENKIGVPFGDGKVVCV